MDRRNFIATTAAAVLGAMVPPTPEMAGAAAMESAAAGVGAASARTPIWNMMAQAVNPAHMVTATGGAPTWTALNLAIEAVEGHGQKVRTIVVHPDMVPKLDAMAAGKMLDDNMFLMGGRKHQEIRHDETLPNGDIDYSKHTCGPIITVEQRTLQAIIDEGVQKDCILLLCDMDKFTELDPDFPAEDGVIRLNPMGMGKVVVSPFSVETDVEVKAY